MKITITFILIALAPFVVKSQNQFIEWNSNVKIKWPDFQGRINTNSPYAAMSAVGIYYKYSSLTIKDVIKIRFDIRSKFDKTKSWSRRALQSQDMLQHEQLHFDIAELIRRQFKTEAENTKYSKHYKNEIAAMFNRYTSYLEKFQKKYDDQTQHSKDKRRQKEWENIIHRELLK